MSHPQYTLTCERCGDEFQAPKKRQRFCGYSCSAKARVRPTPEQRLWPLTDRTGPDFQGLGPCWRFTGSLVPDGYGTIMADGKRDSTHRVAWRLTYGPIPDGMFVLHKCDVRNCVNPAHLFLGTHRDNMDDMTAKGRAASGDRHASRAHPERRPRGDANGSRRHPERLKRGEENPVSKLTEHEVRDMRQMRRQGRSTREIAEKYRHVSLSCVYQVLSGRLWAHVP